MTVTLARSLTEWLAGWQKNNETEPNVIPLAGDDHFDPQHHYWQNEILMVCFFSDLFLSMLHCAQMLKFMAKQKGL